MSYYLYRHRKITTGMPFYVGIGVKRNAHEPSEIYERAYNGTQGGKARRSELWIRTAAKHGVKVEILLECGTVAEIKKKEIEFIKLYGRKNQSTGVLVNLTDGGDGMSGYLMTEEGRLKRRVAKLGKPGKPWSDEHRRRFSATMRGHIISPETRDKISKTNRGRPHKKHTQETRSMISKNSGKARIVLCLNTGIFFDSASETARQMFPLKVKAATTGISHACCGHLHSYTGFKFVHV